MASGDKKLIKQLIGVVKKDASISHLNDLFEMSRIYEAQDSEFAHKVNKDLRKYTTQGITSPKVSLEDTIKYHDLHKRSLLFDAPINFDAYLQYIEWNREPHKKFYVPRRSVLKVVVDDLQALEDGELDFLSVSLPVRTGKAQPLDSKVLTPTGYVRMGELSLGDMVMSASGKPSKIIGVFPQGVIDVYEITFNDGSKVECSKDHLWRVQTSDDRRKDRGGEKYRTVTLGAMLKNIHLGKDKRHNYTIDYVKPIEFGKKELLIHPYVLGVILGDGAITDTNLNITSPELEIIDKVKTLLPVEDTLNQISDTLNYRISKKDKTIRSSKGWMVKCSIQLYLEKYGLKGCGSHTKFIPKDYLYSSVNDRWELLRGLCDTDGFAGGNYIEYSSASQRLAENVQELVRSLGGFCSMSEKDTHYVKDGKTYSCSTSYRLYINFPNTAERPFFLNRKNKTYKTKRSVTKRVITSVELIGEKECQCIMIDDPSHLYITDNYTITHNSTIGCFFMTWLMGKYPDLANVMSAHSEKLTRGFYKEVISIITDPQYLWSDVFPTNTIGNTSAEDLSIDINDKGTRFPTLTCRSIGSTLTGAVEVAKCLYCDDLIEDLEEALNPKRLENKYDAYANQLKDRMKEGAYQVMIGTRWSVADVQGRILDQYKDNPRYRFRAIPALNEKGESNFDYPYGLGFSTEHFLDMKASIDDATWAAKYMGDPYVREGLLFPKDELNYYNGVLPDTQPDRIVAVLDIAWGGGDSTCMPIGYVFGDRCYIHDVVHNKGDKTVTQPLVVGRLMQHLPHITVGEANAGGEEYMESIDRRLREQGVRINVTSRKTPSTQAKLSRIIQMSPEIKKFYYIDFANRSQEYNAFMGELNTFVTNGKNPNDDAPDALAMLANELYFRDKPIEIFKRPF